MGRKVLPQYFKSGLALGLLVILKKEKDSLIGQLSNILKSCLTNYDILMYLAYLHGKVNRVEKDGTCLFQLYLLM